MKPTLSGPHQKFCEGIVVGSTAADAYRAAYPNTTADNARKNAARLATKAEIQAEIARQRAVAEKEAGSAVLTLVEKRGFLARIFRARVALLPQDSDLLQSIKKMENGCEIRVPDKIAAIKLDNGLAGEAPQEGVNITVVIGGDATRA